MKNDTTFPLPDPREEYYHKDYPKQSQDPPGLQSDMKPVPDCGEASYRGHGRMAGRKALITGGDSGIGRAAAIALAREGADIAVNYLPSEQSDADSLAGLLRNEGRKVTLIPGDLSDESTSVSVVETAYRELGGLDTLILAAGMQQAVEHIEDLSTEQFRKTFETNLFPMFWIVKAALQYLPAGSSIVTTASVEGFTPNPHLLDYASSKGAIITFTKALAHQLAEKGIRANAVAPGPVWSALQVTGGQLKQDLPEFGQQTPMKRAGQPVEMAPVYVLLASDEGSYITAQVYGATGGMYTA